MLISDITKAFFLLNGMSKLSVNYDELVANLEKTTDVSFDLK
jgi:hypothetical protein